MMVNSEREHFERLAREAQASAAYQRQAQELERERQRAQARERGERLRAAALRVLEALARGERGLATELEALIHDVGAGVESLAAWAGAAKARRELTPIELRGVKAALESRRLELVLDRTDKLIRAKAADRPRLLAAWRASDSRGASR